MFNNFDGNHRRTPNVSIRGASKKESKAELLERAQRERSEREANRTQHACAIKIQSFYRGHLLRKRLRDQLRLEFDGIRSKLSKTSSSSTDQKILLSRLLKFFFRPNQDVDRLSWLCQLCVRERRDIFQKPEVWFPFKICGLLKLALRFCSEFAQESDNITAPLRLVEIFSDLKEFPVEVSVALFKVLVSGQYYSHLRHLVDRRLPPMIAETLTPPTPISETVLSLILIPLKLISNPGVPTDAEFSRLVVCDLTANFFTGPFSEQVELFILPSLAENKDFPFNAWVDVLSKYPTSSPTPWLFYSALKLGKKHTENLSGIWPLPNYLTVLNELSVCILPYRQFHQMFGEKVPGGVDRDDDDDDEAEDEEMTEPGQQSSRNVMNNSLKSVLQKSLDLLNSLSLVGLLVSISEGTTHDAMALQSLCRLCHNLLIFDEKALHKYRILYTLAFKPALLHKLWNLILATKRDSIGTHSVPLLMVISRGIRVTSEERDQIVPLLAVFDALFGYLLVTIHDIEFYGDEIQGQQSRKHIWMPFTLNELVPMSLALRDVTLGLIELAFPESRPVVKEEYQQALKSFRTRDRSAELEDTLLWTHLFNSTVMLVRQLYTRDTRRQFCPDNHWISDRVTLPMERTQNISLRRSRLRHYRPFQGLRMLTREELVSEGPPLSAKEVRLTTVLRELPCAISFSHRVQVFHNLVAKDRDENQGELSHFLQGKAIHIHVRRNFLYEDAFEKLSQDNEPNLRLKMRVGLTNAAGLDEAGIDGGGLFREFLTELLKTCFDPNRGFFRLTNDQQLYPNPTVDQIHENSGPHYFFIGRMLGKALYENMLIELPFASFFLSKMLGQHNINVDIDHLQSLDPVLYKNLLSLKTYDGDVQDLDLDFTIMSEELGRTTIEELKPGGSDIAVNNDNRIEYIHLVADYKLNKQIKTQCNAFRQGLSDVINLDWLRMFSYRELQTLISGADTEINVDDLMKNTKYGNGFTETHETIIMFWEVVRTLSEKQKRQLLKFVTSCSRPPLLGFKELYPPFCIQNSGSEPDRLPTASTCMNLLKLPEFQSQEILKTKLLYAIESGAGFELS